MCYQIECVVTKIEFGEKIFLSFEPTSKYQLKINGYTIYVAVGKDVNEPKNKDAKIVAVPKANLTHKECSVKQCRVLTMIGANATIILDVDEEGQLVAFK